MVCRWDYNLWSGISKFISKIDSLNCPVVCIESPGGNQTDNVIIDDCALIREAITDMIQCGHRKIGCIYGVSDAYTTIQRTNGYKEGLLVNKIKEMIPLSDVGNLH